MSTQGEITRNLLAWQANPDDPRTAALLARLTYDHLRQIARGRLQRESSEPLTPTELVHEAWLRIRPPGEQLTDRKQFFRFASTVMRSLLVDQARERLSRKRGGDQFRVTLSLAEREQTVSDEQLLDIDRVLVELGKAHPRPMEIVNLRCFGGLSIEEMAELLEVSPATIKRDWKYARAWLADALRVEQQDAD